MAKIMYRIRRSYEKAFIHLLQPLMWFSSLVLWIKSESEIIELLLSRKQRNKSWNIVLGRNIKQTLRTPGVIIKEFKNTASSIYHSVKL